MLYGFDISTELTFSARLDSYWNYLLKGQYCIVLCSIPIETLKSSLGEFPLVENLSASRSL